MNRGFRVTLLSLMLMTAGCGPVSTSVPASITPTEPAASVPPNTVVASAVVVPAIDAQLSFVIAGTVKELDVKEGDKVQAGQTLMVLNMPDLEYAVLQAEDAARAAEFEYQYWIPARFDRPPERRQLAEQELVKVQRSLDSARAELTQATLTAPFDGTIVSLDTAPGELVQPNQVVITLANLGHLKVETTDLSERDLPDVQVGQTAVVVIEALGEEFSGKVVAISPIANLVGGDAVYRVTLELDRQPANLRWGMSAEVNISTQ